MTPTGPFSDDYLFTLDISNKLFSTVLVNKLTQVLDIENGVATCRWMGRQRPRHGRAGALQ